jgi:hypothetical protein
VTFADARLRRTLTTTPLARRFERTTGREVAFSAFDRTRYPAAALRTAALAQSSLAVGEWMAVDLFARLTTALTLAGAPIDLVSAAAKVPTDEVRHADLALRMAAALTDEEIWAPPVEQDRHAYLAAPMSIEDLDYAMLEPPAIGETLACALLSTSRDNARDPVARALFSALLRDEVHHARLGWYYLAWRKDSWTAPQRQRVADRAGNFVAHVEVMFGKGRDAPRGARTAARALGVLDTPTQRAAIRAIMEQEILPGLDGLGRVAFAIDPRARVLQPDGPLWHARSAIAIEALAEYAGASTRARFAALRTDAAAAVARARRWLAQDVARGLRGASVPGWPDDRASVIGTLALACLAGVPVHDRLRDLVAARPWPASPAWPWHAGQVALALGHATPLALWQWCIDDLARRPFAPYVALAARARCPRRGSRPSRRTRSPGRAIARSTRRRLRSSRRGSSCPAGSPRR